ncbi:MAG: hypothetical protein WAZ40_01365 [Minisyncoccia bacterium]
MRTNPEGFPSLSIWASLLASLKLLSTGVTRYPTARIAQSTMRQSKS